jgi:hypothetical protein
MMYQEPKTRNYHREIAAERDELKTEVRRLRSILLDASEIFEGIGLQGHAITFRALVHPARRQEENQE